MEMPPAYWVFYDGVYFLLLFLKQQKFLKLKSHTHTQTCKYGIVYSEFGNIDVTKFYKVVCVSYVKVSKKKKEDTVLSSLMVMAFGS